MTSSVIQASVRVEFEDWLRIGNQSEAGKSLQRVCTTNESKGIIFMDGLDQIPQVADEFLFH